MVADDDDPVERPDAEFEAAPLDVSDAEPMSEAELEIEEAYQKALDALQGLQWPTAQEESGEATEDEAEIAGLDAETSLTEATASESIASNNDSPVASTAVPPDETERLTPHQIVEAALFVGGGPLSTRKLSGLLGSDHAIVERTIDELNAQYLSENRPYEIHLVEGGYQLGLLAEFEAIRNRVHGVGPREVRLSQDALEILALVAYRQPISAADVEASGKKQAGNILRQLLRRELIALQRIDKSRNGIRYLTTPRFLQLFGLGSLADLPQADELSMR